MAASPAAASITGQVVGPTLHELAASFQQIASLISRFDAGRDVRQSRFRHLTRNAGLSTPGPETRPESMRRARNPEVLERGSERSVAEYLTVRLEDQAAVSWPRFPQQLHGARRQRNPMRALGLGALRGHGPNRVAEVDLGPIGRPQLAPPHRRQHQKLERRPAGGRCRRCPHRTDSCGHVAMGRRPVMLRHPVLPRLRDADRRIALPKAGRNGPLEDDREPLKEPPGRRRLRGPDRLQALQ